MMQCANTPELLDYLLWLWYHWNFILYIFLLNHSNGNYYQMNKITKTLRTQRITQDSFHTPKPTLS